MEVDIKFEPSGQVGVVAVGSYLFDAAQRMGIGLDAECGRLGQCDSCAVEIIRGQELLSPLTAAEIEQLSESQRKQGKRLSCQTKIEKQGGLVVMVAEKKQTDEEKEAELKRKLRREFEELPLEKKVANLLELEMITLSDTFSFILNSPYAIAGKIMDVMAEFGLKLDDKAKKAKRPDEHEPKTKEDDKKQSKGGGKGKATETVNEAS